MKTIMIRKGPFGYWAEVYTKTGGVSYLRRYRGIPVADRGEPTMYQKRKTIEKFARKYIEVFGGTLVEEV